MDSGQLLDSDLDCGLSNSIVIPRLLRQRLLPPLCTHGLRVRVSFGQCTYTFLVGRGLQQEVEGLAISGGGQTFEAYLLL